MCHYAKGAPSSVWKCIKSVRRPGSARTHWGSLHRSPRPLAGCKGKVREKEKGQTRRKNDREREKGKGGWIGGRRGRNGREWWRRGRGESRPHGDYWFLTVGAYGRGHVLPVPVGSAPAIRRQCCEQRMSEWLIDRLTDWCYCTASWWTMYGWVAQWRFFVHPRSCCSCTSVWIH